jgi:hypothetical protein
MKTSAWARGPQPGIGKQRRESDDQARNRKEAIVGGAQNPDDDDRYAPRDDLPGKAGARAPPQSGRDLRRQAHECSLASSKIFSSNWARSI